MRTPGNEESMDDTETAEVAEAEQREEQEEPNPLLQIPAIPRYVAVKIWKEGTDLSSLTGSICESPGCHDGNAWLVQSAIPSHRQPYFVECRKSGQVVCEKGCALFHSCGICTHSVAVARFKGCLDQFLSWFGKQKGTVNVSNLASTGMPSTSGKKRSHRKSCSKSTTQRIKSVLANANEKDHRPRIPTTAQNPPAPQVPVYSPPSCLHSPDITALPICSPPSLPSSSASPGYSCSVQSPVTDLPEYSSNIRTTSTPSVTSMATALPPSSAAVMPPHDFPSFSPTPLIHPPFVQQLNMPVMYSPMQITQEGSGNRQTDDSTFFLLFVKGNISRCAGCGKRDLRGVDGKPHPPPDDLCLQHKEYVVFENPRTGSYQQSRDLRNVYYHVRKTCLQLKFPRPHIIVSQDIKSRLLTIHRNHVLHQFGLSC